MARTWTEYYLWRGTDAIEDLEECKTEEEAVTVLTSKGKGDWTLWRRTFSGLSSQMPVIRLLAVKRDGVEGLISFQMDVPAGDKT